MKNTESLTEVLLKLERAALDRWIQGDPGGYLELSAPEVTYFDPFIPRRIDGLVKLTEYYEGLRGRISADRYEILNPKVEASDRLAVLSFNFVSYQGSNPMRWNCTEVYRQNDRSEWTLIQTHWSMTEGS